MRSLDVVGGPGRREQKRQNRHSLYNQTQLYGSEIFSFGLVITIGVNILVLCDSNRGTNQAKQKGRHFSRLGYKIKNIF